MDPTLLIHIESSVEARPIGWSLGHCPHCNGTAVVRVEDLHDVTRVWFYPVGSRVVGRMARCDFCERPVERWLTGRFIDLAKWSPRKGTDELAQALEFDLAQAPPASDTATRLRALMATVQEASSMKRTNVTRGIVAGLLLGGGVGGAIGFVVFSRRIADAFGCAALGVFIGLPAGAILGALVHALVQLWTVPARMLQSAYDRYGFDPRLPITLATESSPRIRWAARKVRDRASIAD